MSALSPHLQVFLVILLMLQGIVTVWSYRLTASLPETVLVALLPFIGLPYLLYLKRERLYDNHVAGALSYLVLLGAMLAFVFLSREEIPWMLLYTMQVFGFLGVLNLVATKLKE